MRKVASLRLASKALDSFTSISNDRAAASHLTYTPSGSMLMSPVLYVRTSCQIPPWVRQHYA